MKEKEKGKSNKWREKKIEKKYGKRKWENEGVMNNDGDWTNK